jgi:tryptophan synthase alpha chain
MFPSRSLIPFVTAGYPDLETTRDVVLELARSGAGLIEIGIPFSDPIADGPVIQRSSFEALRHGYGIQDYLAMVKEVRGRSSVPLIFMTYLNPVLQYGIERLDREGAEAGLDGLLVSDLTPDAAARSGFRAQRLKLVYLVAPTTAADRVAGISRAATGFVYVVARTGVTGRQTNLDASLAQLVGLVRRSTSLPVAVGFGIRTRDDVTRVWEFAEGAVVGSAIVSFMEEHRRDPDLARQVGHFVREVLMPHGTRMETAS